MTTTTIAAEVLHFANLADLHDRATFMQTEAAALHNEVEAQLIDQAKQALVNRDDQALRDLNDFMVDVLWDCGDDFAAEPFGLLQLMRHYDRDFCAHQLMQAERALRCDA